MNNKSMIIFLLVALAISLIGFSLAIYYRIKRIRLEKEKIYVKVPSKYYFYKLYLYLEKRWITQRYLRRIKKKYQIYEPYNIKLVCTKTMKLALFNWICSGVLVILSFYFSRSSLMIITTVIVIILMNDYMVYEKTAGEEIKFLKQLDAYFGNVRHYYYQYQSVEEAVYESANDTPNPLKYHIEKIYEILDSEDIDTAVNNYSDIVPNRFLKLFLSDCVMIIKFGDREVEGESVFLKNLLQLKKDISEEVNKREKLRYRMSGLIVVCLLPMWSLELIKKWAISNVSDLQSFYEGFLGLLLVTFVIVVTVFSYNMIINIKQIKETCIKATPILKKIVGLKFVHILIKNYKKKNFGWMNKINDLLRQVGDNITFDEFLAKRLIYAIVSLLICLMITIFLHSNNRKLILNNTDEYYDTMSSSGGEKSKLLVEAVKKYTLKYKKSNIAEEDLIVELRKEDIRVSEKILEITAQEIIIRVQRYKNEYIKWYEVLISMMLSLVGYYIQYWYLIYRNHIVKMDMEDEVIQFQTLIMMMMYVERICVDDILRSLEDYAVIFRKSISECINEYPSGDIEALEHLKEKEKFPLFIHLVDNLIICDQIGIRKAFDEIQVERAVNQEKRKLDNEVLIGQKVLHGTILAWIPFVIVIALYLIIPFISESVSGFVEYEYEITQVKEVD